MPTRQRHTDRPTRSRPGRGCPAAGTRRHARDDRGSSTVEFAILFPIIVMLLFGGTQTALWYFGREAAQAAAQAGARAASLHDAPAGAGVQAANAYLDQVGRGTLDDPAAVDETDTATAVSIHIHARVLSVIPLPGFDPSVDVTVTRPKEAFTTPGSGP